MIRVGINGFGRIGRCALKLINNMNNVEEKVRGGMSVEIERSEGFGQYGEPGRRKP